MLLVKCILIFVFTVAVTCADSDKAKVEEVKKNSTINYVKYTSNGAFNVPNQNQTLIPHRVATAQDQGMITQCGGIFRNLQNLIESPKFISPRPICNLRCEYQIVSPYICENEFHVQFLDFAIESSQDCENDRVIINYSEIMCGKIIGVKKFKTLGGVLNITFASKSWNASQGKGFRLLVTRLPCIDDSKEQQTEIDSLEPTAPKASDRGYRCFNVNSSYSVDDAPMVGLEEPIYGTPVTRIPDFNETIVIGRQDIPVLPLPRPPIYPPIGPPIIPPILPPQFLPQCCRNLYNQQRFLLISQGFPAYSMRNNDCIFVIHRSSPNVCRLRIIFKYFLLDDPQQGRLGCFNNFLEIDGQRICGCRNNFVYETQWGLEPKVLRLRTMQGNFANAQGFAFDIIQETCPFKIQDSVRSRRQKRFLFPGTIQLHPFLRNPFLSHPQQPTYPQLPPIAGLQPSFDIDDTFKSKFFQPNNEDFGNNVCVMNHLKFFQLKLETIALPKQFCLPF